MLQKRAQATRCYESVITTIPFLCMHAHTLTQESLLLDPMFEVPGSEIKGVHINEECVTGGAPLYIHRTTSASSSNPSDNSQTGSTTEEEENRKYRVKQ